MSYSIPFYWWQQKFRGLFPRRPGGDAPQKRPLVLSKKMLNASLWSDTLTIASVHQDHCSELIKIQEVNSSVCLLLVLVIKENYLRQAEVKQ